MDEYIEDRLSGRRIFWCPGGEGYLAYCPQPTDRDEYSYCCTYYYLGQDLPSCCRFPFHTGVIVAFVFSMIVIVSLGIFLTCWCCVPCPLAKRLIESAEEREIENFDQFQAKSQYDEYRQQTNY